MEPAPPNGSPVDVETRLVEVVFPNMLNHHGSLFGGQALRMMDTAAFIAATRRTRRTMVTVGVKEVDYVAPVHHGEIVEVTAEVSAVGRSSVQVAVEMIAEELLTGTRRLAGRGSFTFVSVDDRGAATPIT